VPDIGSSHLDALRPIIAGSWVKAHDEGPDLVILFHSGMMRRNNPLLALSPYGSLVWRGIVAGATVEQIRGEALHRFGVDEVLPFLRRLAGLEFLQPLPERLERSAEPERIVKEIPAPEVQFRLAHAAVPWYCLWEVTTLCNLRCRICYLRDFSTSGPALSTALAIARQIVEAGVFYVCLLGGEPLLRRDLEEIVGTLRSAGVFVKVITNGLGLDAQRAAAFARAGLNQVEVSFDGLSAVSHEYSRGSGTFARACQAISHAQEAGLPRIGIVWTVHSGNLQELPQLPSFMDQLGVTECYISPFKKTGLLGAQASLVAPKPAELEHLRGRLDEWRRKRPHLTIVLLPTCSCGRTSVVVGADGEVRLCSFSYQGVGNVHERSLREIWNSIGAATLAEGPLGYCARPRMLQIV
jgi:MoaA/NifB/PqqE/SkfB family radical SAM enzyme